MSGISELEKSFIKSYSSDTNYKHTAMVNHRGTVISFAMDDRRQIYYAVLDVGKEDNKKGLLDVKYWADNPQALSFPNEIEQVGYAIVNPVRMPVVNKDTRLEANTNTAVSLGDIDVFLSTTARLTADAPFQVFSDNQHIYVFRQSLAGDHADMAYKLKSGGSSGTETDLAKYVTDKKVPLVADTLLVDRFILAGTVLNSPREVRFRRSKNRSTPASAKDSLGAKDMEGKAFYEPTRELDFVRHLSNGCFSVILLPTQVADIERWQIFAYNTSSKSIESFNIERDGDGFFNLQGTQLYTSPDPQYKTSVLERKPGSCPFTGRALVPNDASEATISTSGYASKALQFDSSNGYVALPTASNLGMTNHDFTVEGWIKVNPSATGNNQVLLGGSLKSANKGLHLVIRDNKPYMGFYGDNDLADSTILSKGIWYHLAFRYTATTKEQAIFVNGNQTSHRTAAAHYSGTESLYLGRAIGDYLYGELDEVRIWNRARSDAEIKKTLNHRLFGDEFGLAGYWRFDETTGNTVTDLSANGNHGTLTGTGMQRVDSDAPVGSVIQDIVGMQRKRFAFAGRDVVGGLSARLYYQQEKQSSETNAKSVKQNARVLLTAASKENVYNPTASSSVNKVLQFDSSDGHVAIENSPALQITGDQTIEMWIKPTVLGMRQNPFDKAFGGEGAITLESNGTLNYYYGTHGGTGYPYASINSETKIVTGDWTHIAIVRDLTNRTLHWYINGIESRRINAEFAAATEGTSSVFIGNGYAGSFTGFIDEVRLWNRACSQAEIRQAMNQRLIGDEFGLAGYWRFDETTGNVINDSSPNGNHGAFVGSGVKRIGAEETISSKKYIAAVDLGISRAGKLAQVPDNIPLPPLLSNSSVTANESILNEISSLETDIPRLDDEIITLSSEIATLTDKIASDEREVNNLSSTEGKVRQLEAALVGYKRLRKVTFYQHSSRDKRGRGSSFEMFTGESKKLVGSWWNDRISGIEWESGLKIETYEHPQYDGRKWIFPGSDSGWNDQISSIKVLESDSLKQGRSDTQSDLTFEQQEVTRLKRLRDTHLPPKRTQKTQKSTLLQTKQRTLTTKNARLVTLRSVRFGVPAPQPMTTIHTDPQGLTVSSGLLGFARTDSQPYLFESALGRMALYFKGANKQFFSAYYDINTARARWSLATTNGTLLSLISRATNSQVNETSIVVADGGNVDHCSVTISNTKTGLTETWNKVPREVNAFAQVLNGDAGEKKFIGKLSNGLSGTAITSIDLKEGLPRETPAGSTLIIDGTAERVNSLKLTVATLAKSGTKQI